MGVVASTQRLSLGSFFLVEVDLMSVKKFVVTALAVCAVSIFATPSRAALLSDLIANNGTITNGDKVFSDFGYLATGQNPPADRVNVVPTVDGDGNLGIRFAGGFIDLDDNGASDALITFKVTATDPNQLINDVHLAFNGDVVGPPGAQGFVGITETFLPTDPNVQLSVFEIQPAGTRQLTDWADLTAPVRELWVQKDIILLAGTGAVATISFIDQTFSQVPEPTSLGFVIAGIVVSFLRRRGN
jgi:hypothetical protein